MKIAYVFATNMATTFKLSTMILPQMEQGIHGVQVIGMMFFDDKARFFDDKIMFSDGKII